MISKDLVRIKDKVEALLKDHQRLRDSDKLLWIGYLNRYHNLVGVIGMEAASKLYTLIMDTDTPTMESVRRIRQKFQEQGLYLGQKREERLRESENVKNWAISEQVQKD